MRYDPESGCYIKEHIYGEGIFSNLASKLFNKTTKELAAKTGKKLAHTALTKELKKQETLFEIGPEIKLLAFYKAKRSKLHLLNQRKK